MKRLLKISSIFLITLLLLESALRLSTLIHLDSALFIDDPDVGYRMRPHLSLPALQTNDRGYNDIDRAAENRSGKTRLAFIGDSYVFGAVPRSQNFVSRIQARADSAGAPVDVLNMGIAGAGPENYLGVVQKDVMDMDVDIVSVLFFVGNDIKEAHPDFVTRVWLGTAREVLRKPYRMRLSSEYFYIARLFRATRRLLKERMGQDQGVVGARDGSFSRDLFLEIEHQRSAIFKIEQSALVQESYVEAVRTLQRMADLTKQAGKRFFVVLAPDEVQVSSEVRASLMDEYDLDAAHYDFEQAQQILKEALAARGILVLDLLPFFTEEDAPTPLYIPSNTHWNKEGNDLAADKIWTFLNEHVLAMR